MHYNCNNAYAHNFSGLKRDHAICFKLENVKQKRERANEVCELRSQNE
jgi:hypothetical protein